MSNGAVVGIGVSTLLLKTVLISVLVGCVLVVMQCLKVLLLDGGSCSHEGGVGCGKISDCGLFEK